ncbi:MAG: biotin/lipoyl attachment protein [Bacteroidetes bacterium]|nr:biotin/lipoyl attachment protein [Bacteroidota bacterium]
MALNGRIYRLWANQAPGEQSGQFTLSLNGKEVSVSVDDQRTHLMRSLRAAGAAQTGHTTVRAPMPGLVVRVLVAPGVSVQKGQGLIILEAMKMENELKADRDGVVKTVSAVVGMPVEKGQDLLGISD